MDYESLIGTEVLVKTDAPANLELDGMIWKRGHQQTSAGTPSGGWTVFLRAWRDLNPRPLPSQRNVRRSMAGAELLPDPRTHLKALYKRELEVVPREELVGDRAALVYPGLPSLNPWPDVPRLTRSILACAILGRQVCP